MNKGLELTPQEEIKRLHKVIEAKNKHIENFMKYDKERKQHFEQMEKDYVTSQNIFNIFISEIKKSKELPKLDKGVLNRLLKKLYAERISYQLAYRAIFSVRQEFSKLQNALVSILRLAMEADDASVICELSNKVESAVCIIGRIRDDLSRVDFIDKKNQENEHE